MVNILDRSHVRLNDALYAYFLNPKNNNWQKIQLATVTVFVEDVDFLMDIPYRKGKIETQQIFVGRIRNIQPNQIGTFSECFFMLDPLDQLENYTPLVYQASNIGMLDFYKKLAVPGKHSTYYFEVNINGEVFLTKADLEVFFL